LHNDIGKNHFITIKPNLSFMKKYLLSFLASILFYISGSANPVAKPVTDASLFSVYAYYQSSADDGGLLTEYPYGYNYVTPNTTVWLFAYYPGYTGSWSYQGGTASSGSWNASLQAWEFYMPSGGWGSYQVVIAGQTLNFTIVANDYLRLPFKESMTGQLSGNEEKGVNDEPGKTSGYIQSIIPDEAVLPRYVWRPLMK
jgi:hypothetical protein